MNKVLGQLVLACLTLVLLVTPARESMAANIILDHSPATTGADVTPDAFYGPGSTWSNSADGQNFADHVQFASDTLVAGMDIYTLRAGTFLRESATIRLYADASGQPGAILTEFTEYISVIDTEGAVDNGYGMVRDHVTFSTPLLLTGGTQYWIGMSGTGINDLGQLGLVGLNAPYGGNMFQFSGLTPQNFTGIGDMAFRLEGVPEPSSIALLGLGMVGLAVGGYRRRGAV